MARRLWMVLVLATALGAGFGCDTDDDDEGNGGAGGTGGTGATGGTGGGGGAGGTGGGAGDEQVQRETDLTGAEEAPPVATGASGTATATLEGNTLTVEGSFEGLESDLTEVAGSSAHVHVAPPGEAGPVVFPLEVTPGEDNRSGTFTGSAELDETQRQDFLAGNHYVNVHSVNYPMGELRGQLADETPPLPEDLFAIELTGAEEVPAVETEATGVASIARFGDVLTINGSFRNLESDLLEVEGSAAHVHQAPEGEAGPIVFNILVEPGDDARSGTLLVEHELTEEQRTAYDAGELYINVHSVDAPMGELRGQIVPPAAGGGM